MRNSPWPVVVIVLGALVAITTLAVLKVDATQVMGFIGAAVIPTVTIMITVQRVESRVDDVHKQVNGRMSQLIEAKTQPSNGSGAE